MKIMKSNIIVPLILSIVFGAIFITLILGIWDVYKTSPIVTVEQPFAIGSLLIGLTAILWIVFLVLYVRLRLRNASEDISSPSAKGKKSE